MKKILLCLLLCAEGMAVHAQQKPENNCLSYYYTIDDSAKDVMKAAFETKYNFDDSTMSDKRFDSKIIFSYNKTGQTLFRMDVDSDMEVVDSSRWKFDDKLNMLSDFFYKRNDSTHRIEIYTTKQRKYDSKNRQIEYDATRAKWPSGYKGGKDENGYIWEFYTTYNAAGDEVEDSTYYDKEATPVDIDTTVVKMRYDTAHHIIYNKTRSSTSSTNYYTYNKKGLVIFHADVTDLDSTYDITKWNDKDSIIDFKRFNNSTLAYSYLRNVNKNGSYSTTEEVIPDADDDNDDDEGDIEDGGNNTYSYHHNSSACKNSTVTVTNYDSAGNIMSSVETKEKDNHPFVTTVLHYYTFNKRHNIVEDSSVTIEEGHLYAMTSQEVALRTYDANDSLVEYREIGGGRYHDNVRHTWKYNKQGKLEEDATFNSCQADKPQSALINTWYPDGKRIKEVTRIYGETRATWYYGEKDSRCRKSIHIAASSSYEIIFDYTD